MTTLAQLDQALRPLQSVDDQGFYPRFLFRGQSKHYGRIPPLIARKPSKPAIKQLYRMFSDASLFASGIGGYHVGRRDGIGLFQHYGLPTPFLDFSGCIDVAIFFALLTAKPGDQAVIYVLDRSLIPAEAVCFELQFFCLPLNEGGNRHRHLRQDAFVLGPTHFDSPPAAADFDPLKPSFGKALTPTSLTCMRATRRRSL